MNIKLVVASAVVFVGGSLLLANDAAAQFGRQVKVSDAVEPGFGGFHEPGISAARCGNNVVVGFGDTESGKANSGAGYAISSDGARSFRDLGVLPVPTNDNFGFGPDAVGANPSVACANSKVFYYAALYFSSNAPELCIGFPLCAGISVSTSKDSGRVWGLPIIAIRASEDSHTFDSPSVAVDPTNTQRLYMAYLETNSSPIDSDFFFPNCDQLTITEVRVVSSSDGGTTWTLPRIVDHACDGSTNQEESGMLSGLKMAVAADGKMYLSYEFRPFRQFGSPVPPNEIRFARSLDQGTTFSAPMVVSTVADDSALPALAVDRTKSAHAGTIYLTWSGSLTGTSTDVLVSESLDQGSSFTFPRPIEPAGTASTHFQTSSALAVDNDGQVAACFYETPDNQPTNSSVYSYNCATSFNFAATWTAQRLANSAIVNFDTLTSDFLLGNDGFFTAFEVSANGTRVVGNSSN